MLRATDQLAGWIAGFVAAEGCFTGSSLPSKLPASHKRVQYEAWRGRLLSYWEHDARRRRPCRMPGCAEPSLASGLCRPHLWSETGR